VNCCSGSLFSPGSSNSHNKLDLSFSSFLASPSSPPLHSTPGLSGSFNGMGGVSLPSGSDSSPGLPPSPLFCSSPLIGRDGKVRGVTLRRLPLEPVGGVPVHLPPHGLLPIHTPPPPLSPLPVPCGLCPLSTCLFSSPLTGPGGVAVRHLPLVPVSMLPVHLPPPSLLPVHMPPPSLSSPCLPSISGDAVVPDGGPPLMVRASAVTL
jgi:hypothetical protein